MIGWENIEIDLLGPVDIIDLGAIICRVVPYAAQQIAKDEVDENFVLDILDPLLERFCAEAHAARLGMTITGATPIKDDE
jgi:hypothetical protein